MRWIGRMRRLSLTLRALLLVPLLAVAVDQARATLVCGDRAESCLRAAGQGWLGTAGTALAVVYALAAALFVAHAASPRRESPVRGAPFGRLWLVGSAGVAAVCGGQALLAGALGSGAALGGGWLGLLALCVLAGAVIALALRAAPAAVALMRALRPRAPRPRCAPAGSHRPPAARARRVRTPLALAAAGRAPPAPA